MPEPQEFTGKWLYNAIVNTPKWQIKSLLGAPKFAMWINYLSAELDGITLPEKTNLFDNWLRSAIVGFRVSQASQKFSNQMIKMPISEEVEELKNIVQTPIVGDLINNLVQTSVSASFPTPAPATPTTESVVVPIVGMPEKVSEKKVEFEEVPASSV